MNKEEQDYASDSDESDEDFCPDKANNSDAPSEEDSDDPISDNEDVPASKKSKSKRKQKERNKQPQIQKTIKESVDEEERVVATRNRSETTTKSSIEKNELESDEEEENSSRKEALWADFLSDIPTTTPSRTNKPAVAIKKHADKEEAPRPIEKKDTPAPPKEPEKVVIKQIFDFAGEEVVVEKTVSADSIKSNGSRKAPAPSEAPRGSVKRPPGGGLGSILGQLDKKKKISVLEKTKLDWDSFKTSEGIDEDLQTFNKGKDGYLQRQDFLERTDLRQFEIEKNLRASKRKPM